MGSSRLPFITYFFVVLLGFSVLNIFLHSNETSSSVASIIEASLKESTESLSKLPTNSKQSINEVKKLADLSCQSYGGPSDEVAREMVYWEDIPEDSLYVSPFHRTNITQYLTFEPDHGGFNNIRMSMETILAEAFAMGRTLVLPPEKHMYLLGKQKPGQRNKFGFHHFFHMEAIHREHKGIQIITMEEFLSRESGNFRDKNGTPTFPPNNRTKWDGANASEIQTLFLWLREVSHLVKWDPEKCLALFPAAATPLSTEELLTDAKAVIASKPNYEDYIGKPVGVNGSVTDRMKENLAGRSNLCIYDENMQATTFLHVPVDHTLGLRQLVHFYAFVFFQEWRQDLWMKRFIRDHVRYIDEIQCAAARIVEAIRRRARSREPDNNPNGFFDSLHVRRGDFQYKATRVEAAEIYEQTKKKIVDGATVYVATDERNTSFFNPLREHYDLVFLDDFKHLLEDVNINYFGHVDQLVASRGRTFYGCWFSTFTGYINRLRGYHSNLARTPGYEEGIIDSYFYALAEKWDQMRTYYPVKKSFYAREFPTSWRLIDTGIGILQLNKKD